MCDCVYVYDCVYVCVCVCLHIIIYCMLLWFMYVLYNIFLTAHTAKEKGLKKLFKRGKQTAVDASATTNGPTA